MKKIFSLLIILLLTNCAAPSKQKVELLFVQSGKNADFNGKILKINNITSNTIYFSNRPQRIVGHIPNADFLKAWNSKKQKDSFKKDSPNAAISYYGKDGKPDVAIVELSDFKVEKNSISYEVKILSGKLPKESREVTLFIDNFECDFLVWCRVTL